MSVSLAAYVISGDNTLELVCGKTVYQIDKNFDLVKRFTLPGTIDGIPVPDGYTSVANIDPSNDHLDIVVTTARKETPNSRLVYVWTVEGGVEKLIASRRLLDAEEKPESFHLAYRKSVLSL